MKIAFNPSTVAALTAPPNNKDITFDLRGQNIFARGVKFYGTDTNTWRDIKINNVSIGSNTLDLRNGSNTTLTNTNGVVTINSTWRPVVDNLTSNSTTSSLSANQGRVLAGLINGKSDSDHNHDDRYVKKSGDTMLGALNFANNTWNSVGDDVYIGNHNKTGIFCIKSANSDHISGIALYNSSETNAANIWFDNANINLDKQLVMNNKRIWIQGVGTAGGNNNRLTLVSGLPSGLAFNTSCRGTILYSNGIAFADPYNGNSNNGSGWIRHLETTPNVGTLEIAVGDDATNEQIHFRWYDTTSTSEHIIYDITVPRATGTLALTSQIPTSLKNPHALTISLNGISQGPYDGSTAKNINITPGSIGAATSGHNHDDRYLKLTGGTMLLGEGLKFHSNDNYFGTDADARIISLLDGNDIICGGGLIIDERATLDGKEYVTELLRIRDSEFKWRGSNILHSGNYSDILDARYYTESEVNSLLDAKLNRQNLSYGTWNPRGYNLAADYSYNGGDLSISENSNKIFVSINGSFWQNDGRYRVLDTSDVASLKGDLTVHQYLSATDTTWRPLIWGGSVHANTNDSTGTVYKSYDKLSWQTSTQTLYATNIQTENIRHLSIGGGIYWNPYVESTTDGSDAASITLVRSGVAGGTTLVLSQLKDANDTIQFQTNNASKLYHNSYPILTTQNTYVNNHKGYIYGAEITQVNNSDTVDGWHKDEINRTLYITSSTPGLSSYWAKLWEINLDNQYNDLTITFLAAASYYPSYFAIFSVYLRQIGSGTSKDIYARLVELIGNIAVGDTELRLYVNNTTGNCQLWGNVKSQYGTMNLSVLKKAWRTETDSSNIGTFFSTHFGSVQSLPGDGWYKAGVIQQNVVGTFNPSSHTHTVFKNNLMIKGTNGISDSASIHLGIGDSGTGFKWISDGVCQMYANNVAIGQWTSGGMDWFKNPTVNGNKIWNAGNDGSGSGLDADTVDGVHASHLLVKRGRLGAYNIDQETTFGTRDIQPESEVTISGKRPFNGWGTLLVIGSLDGASNQQLAFTGNNRMFIRCAYGTSNNYNTKDWATVALTSDNVASATKLQTPRTIWGHSFDGTNNVDGTLRIKCTTSDYQEGICIQNADSTWCTIRLGNTSNSGTTANTWSIHRKSDNNFCISRNSSDGVNGLVMTTVGMGLGTTSPSHRLHVVGDIYSSDTIRTAGQMWASGFHLESMNSNNYMLLAGGGYKSFGGEVNNPIFLGYLNLDHGDDGTISSLFSCLGYSVPFTYTRGGNYCRIYIPDTPRQVFYIKAAVASVNYSGGGMDAWVGLHRSSGAWWLHCYASGANEVKVKGFRQDNHNNDSWWGGNPLLPGNDGANRITVCIFGYVTFR